MHVRPIVGARTLKHPHVFQLIMLSEISKVAILVRNRPYRLTVIPAKAGIYRQHEAWIPAFAGMTFGLFLCGPPA
jgi:hypothetical protein